MTQLINPMCVDISHYEDVLPGGFATMQEAGIFFVINKATEGASEVDHTFALRRPEAKAAGVKYGAYHFMRPGDVMTQVNHFLATIGDTSDLLMALDHEDPQVPLANARAFIEGVHAHTNRWPWLYSGFLIKEQLKTHDPFWANIPLWLSEYASTYKLPVSWTKPTLWQFTGDGLGPKPHTVPGIATNNIDINSFAGDADDLRNIWLG